MGDQEATCEQCQAPFQRTQPSRRFCSKKCRCDFHNARQVWAKRPDRERRVAAKREKYRADPEAAARRLREWRAANPEKQKAIERRRWEQHADEIRRRNREAHHRNRDERNSKRRQHFAEHREESNARRLAHHYAHREHANRKRSMNAQKARLSAPWRGLLNAAKWRAKQRGLTFALTDEWARERWTGRCELSDIPFVLGRRESGPKTYSPSIDQIRAKGGYTPDNCRFVIWAVNALKHDGTDEDVYRIARAIVDKNPNVFSYLGGQNDPPPIPNIHAPDDDFALITS